MKRIALIAILTLTLAVGTAAAAETFPDLVMTNTLSQAQKAYLGVGDGDFKLSDIKADTVLVEVYSMYCPICQRDAPRINELYDEIAAKGLDDSLKMIGVAAGNTPYEVEFYRKKFSVEFPLVEDPDYVHHKALNGVGTPAYYLVDLKGGELEVLFSSIGEVEDKAAFNKTIFDKVGN